MPPVIAAIPAALAIMAESAMAGTAIFGMTVLETKLEKTGATLSLEMLNNSDGSESSTL